MKRKNGRRLRIESLETKAMLTGAYGECQEIEDFDAPGDWYDDVSYDEDGVEESRVAKKADKGFMIGPDGQGDLRR